MISNSFMMTDPDSDESYYDLLASRSTSEPADYKYFKLPIVLINRNLSSNVFSDEENPKSLEVSSGLNITTYDYTRKLSNFCQLIQKKKYMHNKKTVKYPNLCVILICCQGWQLRYLRLVVSTMSPFFRKNNLFAIFQA